MCPQREGSPQSPSLGPEQLLHQSPGRGLCSVLLSLSSHKESGCHLEALGGSRMAGQLKGGCTHLGLPEDCGLGSYQMERGHSSPDTTQKYQNLP